MSSALAVAATSFVMVDLLNNGLIDRNIGSTGVGNVIVSAIPPDLVKTADKDSQLVLFLYHVTPNQGWRNVGLPGRDSAGNRVANPPLALDLHYLLIAYGSEQLHGEILLGYAMQLLHETPVLTRDAIRRSLAAPTLVGQGDLPQTLINLYTSELAEQVEMIKITPQLLTIDELSKLWTAFQTQYYRPSAAYQVSVVLIESRASTRSTLPVRSRSVQAIPFQKPTLNAIASRQSAGSPIVADQPILRGYELVLQGSQLKGESTSVLIDALEVVPPDTDIGNEQIIVALPASLDAGVHTVQVIQQAMLSSPPSSHRAIESNSLSFVLHPTVTGSVSGVQGTGNDPRSGTLDLTLDPPVGPFQRMLVLLNQILPVTSPLSDASPLSYSFVAPPLYSLQSPPDSPPSPASHINVPFSGVAAGTYLLRVQLDGAESPLYADPTGLYANPKVTIA